MRQILDRHVASLDRSGLSQLHQLFLSIELDEQVRKSRSGRALLCAVSITHASANGLSMAMMGDDEDVEGEEEMGDDEDVEGEEETCRRKRMGMMKPLAEECLPASVKRTALVAGENCFRTIDANASVA